MPLRLGLPAWAYPGWNGTYLQSRPSALASYARVFTAVEGNTSFYATPSADNVERWRQAVQGSDLRFSFKLPATITHALAPPSATRTPSDSPQELQAFFDTMAPLASHLGPFLVQFPASVGPARIDALDTLFDSLPARYRYVVEVRHPAFFNHPDPLDDVLRSHGLARVMMDTRALFSGDPDHPDVRAARHEKPRLPLVCRVRGHQAFIRLVLHPDSASNQSVIDGWVPRIAGWLLDGVEVTLMVHCPNNQYCPPFARDIHERLCRHPGLEGQLRALPPWPVPQQIGLPL